MLIQYKILKLKIRYFMCFSSNLYINQIYYWKKCIVFVIKIAFYLKRHKKCLCMTDSLYAFLSIQANFIHTRNSHPINKFITNKNTFGVLIFFNTIFMKLLNLGNNWSILKSKRKNNQKFFLWRVNKLGKYQNSYQI